jgi:hypothetical protein
MGIGSAIGAIAGIGAMSSARKASRRAESYYDQAMQGLQSGYDSALHYDRYGYQVADQLLNVGIDERFNETRGRIDDVLARLGRSDAAWGRGEGTLEEALKEAKGFKQFMADLSKEYGEFAQGLMDDWEETFGGIEQNVVDYYANLDPTKFAIQQKQSLSDALDKNMQMFNEVAAQSGIYTSGMKQQAQKEMMFQKAKGFQEAELMAEDYVRGQQAGFYQGVALPQKQQAIGYQADAYDKSANWNTIGETAVLNQYNRLGDYQGRMAQGLASNAGTALGAASLYNNAANAWVNNKLNTLGYMRNLPNRYVNQGRDMANIYGQMGNRYSQSASGYGQFAGQMFGKVLNSLFK